MKWLFILPIFFAFAFSLNDRPVVGILAEPVEPGWESFGKSYLAASYVKWVEQSGGRVIPIPFDLPNSTLEQIFQMVDGIIYPGGGCNLDHSMYYNTAKFFYDRAIQENDAGGHFPIWGTCLGFELLLLLTGQDFKSMGRFDAENITLPLTYTDLASRSKLFSTAPKDVFTVFGSQPVTMNNHMSGMDSSTFNSIDKLVQFYDILSTNKDREGKEFISTIESKKYPIFGTQWHPEKVQYEWNPDECMNHSPDSINANRWTSFFFLEECRKSSHAFDESDLGWLIYAYTPIFTFPKVSSSFQQIYFFPPQSQG